MLLRSISHYRCDLCIDGGSRGKIEFFVRRPLDLWHSFFRLSLIAIGATTRLVISSAIATVRSLEEVFAHRDGFSLAVHSRWFRSRI